MNVHRPVSMKQLAAGNDSFGSTEEPVMGIFSRFGSRKSAPKRSWFSRLVMPAGHDDPTLDEIKRVAIEEADEIEAEGRKNFRPDGPGSQEDDL